MALFCVVSTVCVHRSFQSIWNCQHRILLYKECCCKMKKIIDNDINQICSSIFTKSSHNKESNDNISLHDEVYKSMETEDYLEEIEEPTTCCMSGCANCVWIEYAEKLSKRLQDGGDKAKEAIMKMSDPNMKAFLLTELKSLKKD